MDAELARAALVLLERQETFVWTTIIGTSGSSPRHGGASMLVRADGSIAGTVGGGALEARAVEQALEVLALGRPRMMEYQLTPQDAAGLGMVCGGSGRVILEPVSPFDPHASALFARLAEWAEAAQRGWLVTTVTGSDDKGWAVARGLVEAGGLAAQRPESMVLEDAFVNVEPVGFQGTAYVFGAGHCGEKLVPVLAVAGFSTVILDDRAEFANPERFPDADAIVIVASFDQSLDRLPIDEESYIVIVTRGHIHDKAVLGQALRTGAGYIGMIGSRKKIATIFHALREEGFSEDDLSRVHAPIGLAIGAETPGEIAVSIAAELVQVRSETLRRLAGT